MTNFERHIAEQFVLHTSKNIFLTGRAGTGKTTFLRDIVDNTTKNTIVVAPTGVAAINAKGVTIHSMFQIPLTAFIPSNDDVDPNLCNNRIGLRNHMKYRADRRKIIESLELLIIDEISMVRADLLDAIDFILRTIRKINKPFGGVQLLVIGDLFQLSPVVHDSINPILKKYYKSPFFFDAYAWQNSNPIKIELTKIYRQKDDTFINILNNVRNGVKLEKDIERLNQNFSSDPVHDGVLTLTTHNYKADALNEKHMDLLESKNYKYNAEITGKFNESSYPTNETINIKVGAQVMFIRNHSEGLYFNGKIGIIDDIIDGDIMVRFLDDNSTIIVEKEEWKNTKYTINKETKKLEQETIGSFEQFPIKLAWAITVHKSQGLTFDKVSVDLSQSFAPGQLYVALSRCRSLDGLILRSKVFPNNIIVDNRVINYYEHSLLDDEVEKILKIEKTKYSQEQLIKSFYFSHFSNLMEDWKNLIVDSKIPEQGKAYMVCKKSAEVFTKLEKIGFSFQHQLTQLFKEEESPKVITERALKAIMYFTHEIYQDVVLPMGKHIKKYSIKKNAKKYIRFLHEILDEIWLVLEKLYALEYHEIPIHSAPPAYIKKVFYKETETKKPRKSAKGETQSLTLELFKTGRSMEEISEARGLKLGTIQSHMGTWIEKGEVTLAQLMEEDKMNKLIQHFEATEDKNLSDLVNKSPITVSYAEMRWIRIHQELKKEAE